MIKNITQISTNIFKVEVPLPQNPLKSVNSYVIKGEFSLIIDTGMNRQECETSLLEAIKFLGLELDKTNFFITHMHADHSGLVRKLATQSSTVYFTKEEALFIAGSDWGNFWEEEAIYAQKEGFPIQTLKDAIKKHPGYMYCPKGDLKAKVHIVSDNEIIKVNDFDLRCIKVPGHTKGVVCLYEEKQKLLFSSDHILCDITPNISAAYENDNPLAEYLRSLDKVYNLNVKIVLPGHRKTFTNLKQRIDELKIHHKNRLNEVLSLLNDRAQNAYEVASRMHWDIKYKDWEAFPIAQKWFAHSEAIAHLQYLKESGLANRFTKDDTFYYEKV